MVGRDDRLLRRVRPRPRAAHARSRGGRAACRQARTARPSAATTPQPIEVRIFDEDRALAEDKAKEVAAILDGVPGVVDVKNGVVVSGPNVTIADRWAIVAYVRALERSRLASLEDVPEALRLRFKK